MKKRIITSIITVLLIVISIICVNAQEDGKTLPDFEVERIELTAEDQAKYIEQLEYKITEFDYSVYGQHWIQSIDVAQNGMIALAFDNNSIVIADQNFQNAYAISFSTIDPYYINWNGEKLQLHFSKSYLMCTFSVNGELLDVSEAIIESYIKLRKTEDTVNGNTYRIKASNPAMLLTGCRDQLIKIDSLGNEEVLFQSENSIPIDVILFFFIFCAGQILFAIIIPVGIVKMKKRGKRYRGQGGTRGRFCCLLISKQRQGTKPLKK